MDKKRQRTAADIAREKATIFNKNQRDLRRIQLTILTFLYAYERKLSLEIIKPYMTNSFRKRNCSMCFYKMYNFVDETGARYSPEEIADSGRSIFTKDFGRVNMNANKSCDVICCINYFIISSLDIDIKKYIARFNIGKIMPFMHLDLINLLHDRWSIDIEYFYNQLENCIENHVKSASIVKSTRFLIPYETIVNLVLLSKIENRDSRPLADKDTWCECKFLFDSFARNNVVSDMYSKLSISNGNLMEKLDQLNDQTIQNIDCK